MRALLQRLWQGVLGLLRFGLNALFVSAAVGLAVLIALMASVWAPVPAIEWHLREAFQAVRPEEKYLDGQIRTNLLSPLRLTGDPPWIEPELVWRRPGSSQLIYLRFRLTHHPDGTCELTPGEGAETLSEEQTRALRSTRLYREACSGALMSFKGMIEAGS